MADYEKEQIMVVESVSSEDLVWNQIDEGISKKEGAITGNLKSSESMSIEESESYRYDDDEFSCGVICDGYQIDENLIKSQYQDVMPNIS